MSGGTADFDQACARSLSRVEAGPGAPRKDRSGIRPAVVPALQGTPLYPEQWSVGHSKQDRF
jgi:hypothetical protein